MKPLNWTDKAATKIAGVFFNLQSRFARFMNKMVAAIPAHKMKTIIILFGLLGGGFSLYLIADAVLIKPNTGIKINPITAPKYFDKTGEELNGIIVDEQTYQQIQVFKQSSIYDSTIKARAGLLDSLELLESIYHSQKFKSSQ
jgi:hypothetical protein